MQITFIFMKTKVMGLNINKRTNPIGIFLIESFPYKFY